MSSTRQGSSDHAQDQISITLNDHGATQTLTCPRGITGTDLLSRAAGKTGTPSAPFAPFAMKVNGELKDLPTPLIQNATVEWLTFDSPEGKEVYRHSSAHLLAQAVKRLFPGAKLAIGPPIEEGFYYDIDYERPFTPDDLAKLEAAINDVIQADLPITRHELPSAKAVEFFTQRQEPYKVELIRDFQVPTVSYYEQGDFIDLCEGPHLPSTGRMGAIKLLSVAGAYWRGDEKKPMLQRIYGTSFPTADALQAHLTRLEQLKQRDHRKLGRELDLFSIQETIGPGLILWHPKGAAIRQQIEAFWKRLHEEHGYQFVYTPHVARLDLWKTSGHVDFYRENMFPPMEIEGADYELKPMNCPFHLLIYQSHLRSYRDLPIRFAELGTVYRFERSGVLHGLLRVRGFTQDDAHIFCRPDQVEEEISRVLELTTTLLGAFGFHDYDIYLSTRPEHYVGTLEHWEAATSALSTALTRRRLAYQIDPGEGVFYGPKIDIKVKDLFGRAWQCATVQVDFNLPERFTLAYRGEDSREHAPIMIHRALMGSLERFFGILIEHYGGAFPTWLAPVQAMVIPISEAQAAYAESIAERLRARQIRVEIDRRNEKMGLKIREAQLQKIPYMIVVGGREQEQQTVSLRLRSGEQIAALSVDALLDRLSREIAERGPSTA
ncbi:MAG: threonine--tRNA ligase [Nitrospirae bacterium]|nr:threonine--tRNA ligase [Nitrospirota bacterium]